MSKVVIKAIIASLFIVVLFVFIRGAIAINVSESLPIGIYIQTSSNEYNRGDLVLFHSEEINKIGVERGYLRPGTQLGKRLVALPGDSIKAGRVVFVNGVRIGSKAKITDSQNRPMEIFEYAGEVPAGQVFVLGDTQGSFDSRYYGFVKKDSINRKLIPLFVWKNRKS